MLKLIYAPDPILKKESVSIPQVDDHHRELIKQMFEVMYSACLLYTSDAADDW